MHPNGTFLKYNSSADELLTLDEIGIALKEGNQGELLKLFANRQRVTQIEGFIKIP